MNRETQITTLPAEVAQIAENVSVEKRNEVQLVLNQVFNGVAKMREQLESVTVEDVNDKVNMKLANTIRLGVRQVRLEAEKTFDAKRTEVQQQMLSYKTEDSLWLKAKQTMQILTKEIEENARWKEETKERFEKEQKELKTQQRIVKVQAVSPEITRAEFENMSDETFDTFYNGLESAYNAKIEAERLAEEKRIEEARIEAERIEAQRIENERLKAESERIAKEREAERVEAEKKLADEKAKADAILQAQKAKAEKERAELEAKAKLEREAQAKIQAEKDAETKRIADELQAKKESELKAETERKALELKAKKEAEKLSKAPIKKQLSVWVNAFEISSTIDHPTAKEITDKFNLFKAWALSQVESL